MTGGCPADPVMALGQPTGCNGAMEHGVAMTMADRMDLRSGNQVDHGFVVGADFVLYDGMVVESRVVGSPTGASDGA